MKKLYLLIVVSGLLPALFLGLAKITFSEAAEAPTEPMSASALRAKLVELSPRLKNNQFDRPIYLNSEESSNQLKGDIYAVIDTPFELVNKALVDSENWCEVLILHLNTKHCKTVIQLGSKRLLLSIGKKTAEELDRIVPIDFSFATTPSSPEFIDVLLTSKLGPMGTSDYRIQLEAVAIKGGGTFLHLNYAYAYNYFGLIAMKSYLATVGRGKVGFTQALKSSSSLPEYLGGMRGVVERNTMRYYLAIEAYLDSLALPVNEQLDRRLSSWFLATERYRRQLHELDQDDYMEMKRQEYARMKSLP